MPWDKEKAKKIFDLTDAAQWGKTFSFGLRFIILILFVSSIIFAVGYWYAMKKRPIIPVDFSSYIMDGKTIRAKLNGDWLQIDHSGMAVTDEHGKVKKQIKVEDVPILSENIKPYRLTKDLIGFYGAGFTINDIAAEAGIGIEWAKLWDFRLGLIATNKAGYASISYPIRQILFVDLHNTAVVGCTGYNYSSQRQHGFGLRVRF